MKKIPQTFILPLTNYFKKYIVWVDQIEGGLKMAKTPQEKYVFYCNGKKTKLKKGDTISYVKNPLTKSGMIIFRRGKSRLTIKQNGHIYYELYAGKENDTLHTFLGIIATLTAANMRCGHKFEHSELENKIRFE